MSPLTLCSPGFVCIRLERGTLLASIQFCERLAGLEKEREMTEQTYVKNNSQSSSSACWRNRMFCRFGLVRAGVSYLFPYEKVRRSDRIRKLHHGPLVWALRGQLYTLQGWMSGW